MLTSDLSTRLALATSDHTSGDVLEQLAVDAEAKVRLSVASNPNTPKEVLLNLGCEFPDTVVANPIFGILLLENPESHFIQLSLARSSTTPAKTLVILAQIPDEEILCAVAENPNTPSTTLEQIVYNPPSFWDGDELDLGDLDCLLARIASRPDACPSLLAAIAKHTSGGVTYALAGNPNTPVMILERLADQLASRWLDYSNQRQLLRNPSTPASVLYKLAGEQSDESEDLRRRVREHPQADPLVIALLDFIGSQANTPVTLLEQFAQHPRPYIRCLVAAHRDTPISVLEALSLDHDSTVRLKIARHPHAPITALENIARWLATMHHQSKTSFYAVTAKALICRPNITPEILNLLSSVVDLATYNRVAQTIAASPRSQPH
jgi:hypothetical protein